MQDRLDALTIFVAVAERQSFAEAARQLSRSPDSTLRAVRVGQVRRVVCASPQYIARRGMPATPRDIESHSVAACTAVTPVPDRWSFHRPGGITPRLVVNATAAAVDAAVDNLGLTCVFSYQMEPHAAAGRLEIVLVDHEPPPLPIYIVHPEGRYLSDKVRLFLDHVADGLRRKFGA